MPNTKAFSPELPIWMHTVARTVIATGLQTTLAPAINAASDAISDSLSLPPFLKPIVSGMCYAGVMVGAEILTRKMLWHMETVLSHGNGTALVTSTWNIRGQFELPTYRSVESSSSWIDRYKRTSKTTKFAGGALTSFALQTLLHKANVSPALASLCQNFFTQFLLQHKEYPTLAGMMVMPMVMLTVSELSALPAERFAVVLEKLGLRMANPANIQAQINSPNIQQNLHQLFAPYVRGGTGRTLLSNDTYTPVFGNDTLVDCMETFYAPCNQMSFSDPGMVGQNQISMGSLGDVIPANQEIFEQMWNSSQTLVTNIINTVLDSNGTVHDLSVNASEPYAVWCYPTNDFGIQFDSTQLFSAAFKEAALSLSQTLCNSYPDDLSTTTADGSSSLFERQHPDTTTDTIIGVIVSTIVVCGVCLCCALGIKEAMKPKHRPHQDTRRPKPPHPHEPHLKEHIPLSAIHWPKKPQALHMSHPKPVWQVPFLPPIKQTLPDIDKVVVGSHALQEQFSKLHRNRGEENNRGYAFIDRLLQPTFEGKGK